MVEKNPNIYLIRFMKTLRWLYSRISIHQHYPGIPTTIKTMGVNITTIAFLEF